VHWAEIENGTVSRVIVCDDVAWASKALGGEWVQVNEARKNFPALGYVYDKNRDAFIPPKPYDSWVLNEETCRYVAPLEMPQDGEFYNWCEVSKAWERLALA
jgi:hypothetical protein